MKYVFTCGGTAGHIYPAISVAEELNNRDPDAKFHFIGARNMMEMDIVPAEGYTIDAVSVTNLSRGMKWRDLIHNLRTVRNLIVSFFQSLKILKRERPDAVIGTGGYVCFPVLLAAHCLHLPTFLHESNAVPGLTTKLLSGLVDRIFVGYEESLSLYPSAKTAFTGTPVRKGFGGSQDRTEEKKKLGIRSDRPLVLSVWGSLGSEYMNKVVSSMAHLILPDEFSLIHVCGKQYYNKYCSVFPNREGNRECCCLSLRDYLYDIPSYYAAADLIMCRAGASTLSELAFMGMPAIIVPSPNVTNNHQEKNARVFERKGAAVVFTEGCFDEHLLLGSIQNILFSEDRRASMATAMKSFSVADSSERIANLILLTIKKSDGCTET